MSLKVRAQYEKNPYPRWVNLALAPKQTPVEKIINKIKLKIYDHGISAVEKPEILIAGWVQASIR